jgi:hypothetical protein
MNLVGKESENFYDGVEAEGAHLVVVGLAFMMRRMSVKVAFSDGFTRSAGSGMLIEWLPTALRKSLIIPLD